MTSILYIYIRKQAPHIMGYSSEKIHRLGLHVSGRWIMLLSLGIVTPWHLYTGNILILKNILVYTLHMKLNYTWSMHEKEFVSFLFIFLSIVLICDTVHSWKLYLGNGHSPLSFYWFLKATYTLFRQSAWHFQASEDTSKGSSLPNFQSKREQGALCTEDVRLNK